MAIMAMAKKKQLLGIDIGSDRLKIALVEDGYVLDAVSTKMPDNLYSEGRITSVDTLSTLIGNVMRENGIKAKFRASRKERFS